jgi:3-deoxy-D-manno-octulosonate 8-phosphate phosphatase (KDO 8-P phosphatase)
MNKKLSQQELKRRARNIKLVLTDNDGVLTDTGVYYGENGEMFKRFSIRDGMGVELLRTAGIETAIITSETSPSVKKRAEKLQMRYLYLGVKDKHAHLDRILQETQLQLHQLAYIGDDVNDIAIMRAISQTGITATPKDGMPPVLPVALYRCKFPGGHGAFRDFADWLLRLRA